MVTIGEAPLFGGFDPMLLAIIGGAVAVVIIVLVVFMKRGKK
ncbi:MAG: hypothetical protein ACP6KW_06785 [Candidatus Thorarchaeota archaeon]